MKFFSFSYLVIDELMKHVRPTELIKLSFCSKKTLSLIKSFSKINEDLVLRSVSKNNGYGISFHGQNDLIRAVLRKPQISEVSVIKTGPGFMFFIDRNGDLCTYWEDYVLGCQVTTNCVCDLFKVPVSLLSCHKAEELWMLDFIQQRQEEKLKILLTPEEYDVSAQDYSSILSCNVTELLECNLTPPEDYEFHDIMPLVENLFIKEGFWITKENLLGLESRNVRISYLKLRSSDIYSLLRCWLNGGLPKLKYLEVDGSNIDFDEDEHQDQDIRNQLEPVQGVITYTWGHNREVVQFWSPETFNIRREDGVVATIKADFYEFIMVVWPDMNDNRV